MKPTISELGSPTGRHSSRQFRRDVCPPGREPGPIDFTRLHGATKTMTFKNILAIFTFIFAILAPATVAQAQEKWEDPKVGPFTLGYWSKLDAGATSVDAAAAGIMKNFKECESKYGQGGCYIQFESSTDINRWDNTKNGKDDALHGGLGEGRTAVLKDAVFSRSARIKEYSVTDYPHHGAKDGWRYSWATIMPKEGASAMPKVSADPNKRWSFLTEVLLRQTDNLCPTMVRADAVTRTYTLQGQTCGCSTFDAVPSTRQLEVRNDLTWLGKVVADRSKWSDAKTLTWTEVRAALEEGTESRVIEVDALGDPSSTPDGLSVEFVESETLLRVQFPDRCSPILDAAKAEADAKAQAKAQADADARESARLAAYNTDFMVGGSVAGTGTFIPKYSPFNPGRGFDLAGHVEGGAVIGGGYGAWAFGLGVGPSWDPNCLTPGQVDLEAFTGPWLNRQGKVGFSAFLNGSAGFTMYNGEVLTPRYRLGLNLGVPVQVERELYLVPQIGPVVDWVSGQVQATGGFAITERVGIAGGLRIIKTF